MLITIVHRSSQAEGCLKALHLAAFHRLVAGLSRWQGYLLSSLGLIPRALTVKRQVRRVQDFGFQYWVKTLAQQHFGQPLVLATLPEGQSKSG